MSQPAQTIADWLQEYNQKVAALRAQGFVLTPQTTRDGLARLTQSMTLDSPAVERVLDASTEDKQPVPVRIYHPAPETPLPVLIYCHGGGHMAGSVDAYDPLCRKLALVSQHVVISVDYRLAPEAPYPAGLDDAMAVIRQYRHILERAELPYLDRLSLAGDSGGGAMCATLAHDLRHDPDVRIAGQALIYPSLDYTMQMPSVDSNGQGYFLHKERMAWLFDNYFQHGEDRRAASPLYMGLDGNIPPTLVITAQFCPLRDEGQAYAERLREAGIKVEQLHFDDMIHAFMNMQRIAPAACDQVYRAVAAFLDRVSE